MISLLVQFHNIYCTELDKDHIHSTVNLVNQRIGLSSNVQYCYSPFSTVNSIKWSVAQGDNTIKRKYSN